MARVAGSHVPTHMYHITNLNPWPLDMIPVKFGSIVTKHPPQKRDETVACTEGPLINLLPQKGPIGATPGSCAKQRLILTIHTKYYTEI